MSFSLPKNEKLTEKVIRNDNDHRRDDLGRQLVYVPLPPQEKECIQRGKEEGQKKRSKVGHEEIEHEGKDAPARKHR